MTDQFDFLFYVEAVAEGAVARFAVTELGGRKTRGYEIAGGAQDDYTAFFHQLAVDFGTRAPHRH